jgi:cobalamin biosynthesis Mg chelatase CobN
LYNKTDAQSVSKLKQDLRKAIAAKIKLAETRILITSLNGDKLTRRRGGTNLEVGFVVSPDNGQAVQASEVESALAQKTKLVVGTKELTVSSIAEQAGSTTDVTPPTSSPSSGSSSSGSIVAIIVGALVAIILISTIVLVVLKRRRKAFSRRTRNEGAEMARIKHESMARSRQVTAVC